MENLGTIVRGQEIRAITLRIHRGVMFGVELAGPTEEHVVVLSLYKYHQDHPGYPCYMTMLMRTVADESKVEAACDEILGIKAKIDACTHQWEIAEQPKDGGFLPKYKCACGASIGALPTEKVM
jgi:hypothetical protein